MTQAELFTWSFKIYCILYTRPKFSLKQTSTIFYNSYKDGESVLLIPGGDKLKVTNENIFDYVKRYATYKMVLKPEPAVKELRRGVHDVISESALNGLTPEDWWLLGSTLITCLTGLKSIFLVNGVGTVDVAKLSSLRTFNDESSLNSDVNNVIRFQKWFWEVVEQFSQSERQELLYFWTGKFFKYWSILTCVFYRCTCTSSWRGSI